MARQPGFDLAAALANPGFTPGARDAAALVELVAGTDEKVASRAAPALASLGDVARRAIANRLEAGGSKVEGSKTEGSNVEKVEGSTADGSKAEGSKAEGSKAEGSKAEGSKAEGKGSKVEGSKVEGSKAEGSKGQGSRSEGARSEGARSEGARNEGARNVGSRNVGSRNEAARNEGSRNEGARNVGSRNVGSRSEGTRPLDDGGRARLVGVLGLLARAGDVEARAMLVAAIADVAPRVRRAAATALGKLGEDTTAGDARRDALAALLARWNMADVTPDERRVLVEALGKLAGDGSPAATDAIARIRALDPGDDAELARRRDRALLMADRSSKRGDESMIVVDRPPPHPVRVVLECKSGLAELLVEELASIGISATARVDFEVGLELAQPIETLFGSHLWSGMAIRVPMRGQQHVQQQARGDDLAARVVATIVDERVRGLMRAWTRGPIRWRLGFASGHKRAVVWRVARDVTAAAPELVNDPTATTWDLLVDESMGTLDIVPRRLVDPRFAWRVADVPAASQPSVAAALVWVAGMRDDDRVWDPFCGSGLEVVERARRGRFARLVGSDVDETALAAARANAEAAAAHVEIVRGDARTLAVGEIDCAITNPPLGSRVHVDAAQLLIETVPNIARQLVRGGRLVWITPALKKTTSACERAGLTRTRSLYVDLGGVRGHLERWEKR